MYMGEFHEIYRIDRLCATDKKSRLHFGSDPQHILNILHYLLDRIAALAMRLIATDGVAWSVGLRVCRSRP